jgi:hypothetical protein
LALEPIRDGAILFPEKVLLREQYSHLIHAGPAIPLYCYPGFCSTRYLVKKGECLNEPGERNEFPQSFIFGQAFARIGDRVVEVKAGESYYIPPNSDHFVWTESDEPPVLIFLARDKGV